MSIPHTIIAAVLAVSTRTPTIISVDTAQAVDPSSFNLTGTDQFRLTLSPEHAYSFRIEWGDGSTDLVTCSIAGTPVVTPEVTIPGASTASGTIDIVNNSSVVQATLPHVLHTYPASGVYDVSIRQTTVTGFQAFRFYDPSGSSGSMPPLARRQTDGYKVQELKQWGGNNFTTMKSAFFGCVNMQLTATDVSYSRLSKCEVWDTAFTQCRAMTNFPLVDMSAATDITSMFNACVSLQSVSPLLDFSNVTKAPFAFVRCAALTSFPALNFDNLAGSITSMWDGCSGLTSFPAISFPKVTSFTSVWRNCSGLLSFPVLNAPLATSLSQPWANCTSMVTHGGINAPVLTSMSNTFKNCNALTTVGPLNVPSLTSMNNTFESCDVLVDNPLPNGSTPVLASLSNTFLNSPLFNGDLPASLFRTDDSGSVNLTAMLQGCTAFSNDSPVDWNTRAVTNLSSLFRSTAFNHDISDWDTARVTSLASTFQSNLAFNQDLSDWNVEAVTTFGSMFSGATAFKRDLAAWWLRGASSSLTSILASIDINSPASPVQLCASPQAYESGSWTKNASTIAQNTATAPDGANTADRLRPSATNTTDHSVSQNITVVSGNNYTVRCALKADVFTYGQLVLTDAITADVYADLATGSIVSSTGSVSVTDIGNGWYVLEITGTATTTTLNVKLKAWDNSSGTSFAGDGVKGIYLWQCSVFASASVSTANYDATLKGIAGWAGAGAGSATWQGVTAAPVVAAGGSGYTVGDVLFVSGGTLATGTKGVEVIVATVDGSGGVLTVTLKRGSGNYSAVPANPAATTGGTGTGCTLTLTWVTKFSALPTGRTFTATSSRYSLKDGAAIAARRNLVLSTGSGGKGWTFTDGGII